MSFVRARSDQNKRVRIQEIKTVAINLFNSIEYTDITLSMIGDQLNFSRANLYKYVKSKEDIYLWILKDQIQSITETLSQYDHVELLEDVMDIYVDILIKHPLYLKLGSMMSLIIERHVSLEALIEFKAFLVKTHQVFNRYFSKYLPNHNDEQLLTLFTYLHVLSTSLYASHQVSEKQLEASIRTDYPYSEDGFQYMLKSMLHTHIRGLQHAT